ncbi:hypothetical protein ACHAWO_000581 [Cyclotella atomus]|uniref:Uncharacterized protein n=1 Tax=Cyclotella atomus TaxID=382360 RepID=A0ABD3PJ76_9STRA
MAKHPHSIATSLLITALLSSIITVSASATGQQARPAEKFSSEMHYYHIHGHRPATSILPVKYLNFHRAEQQPAADKKTEFDRLNKAKERRHLTRKGLHDAVVHATRQSGDIVVMGATSWN